MVLGGPSAGYLRYCEHIASDTEALARTVDSSTRTSEVVRELESIRDAVSRAHVNGQSYHQYPYGDIWQPEYGEYIRAKQQYEAATPNNKVEAKKRMNDKLEEWRSLYSTTVGCRRRFWTAKLHCFERIQPRNDDTNELTSNLRYAREAVADIAFKSKLLGSNWILYVGIAIVALLILGLLGFCLLKPRPVNVGAMGGLVVM